MPGLGGSRARLLVELGRAKAGASLQAAPHETRTRRVQGTLTNLPVTHIQGLRSYYDGYLITLCVV